MSKRRFGSFAASVPSSVPSVCPNRSIRTRSRGRSKRVSLRLPCRSRRNLATPGARSRLEAARRYASIPRRVHSGLANRPTLRIIGPLRPRPGPIPVCGRSSGVEHNLAKVGVESSNLFARSNILTDNHDTCARDAPVAFVSNETQTILQGFWPAFSIASVRSRLLQYQPGPDACGRDL